MENNSIFYIDFDETIAESIEQFCKLYNQKHSLAIDYKKVKQYDFKDVYPYITDAEVQSIFSSEEFFEGLKLKPNCYNVLNKIQNLFTLKVVTIGTAENLENKEKYIKMFLPQIKAIESIRHTRDGYADKSVVNMRNAIILDDKEQNLYSC